MFDNYTRDINERRFDRHFTGCTRRHGGKGGNGRERFFPGDMKGFGGRAFEGGSRDIQARHAVEDNFHGEGLCPLCRNHCPLSAPGCSKGEAFASTARNNNQGGIEVKTTSLEKNGDSRELAHLFRYAARLMSRFGHGRKHDRHAPHAQGKVLAILLEKGPTSQGELLEILDVRSSSLSELLGKLQARGLIERERSETDRRSFVITATDAASELMSARTKPEEDAAEDLFSCLSSEERETLHGLMIKIVSTMQDTSEPGNSCIRGYGKRRFHDGRPHNHGRKSRKRDR